eukprot:5316783-Pyramimonas_sp.AAC.1
MEGVGSGQQRGEGIGERHWRGSDLGSRQGKASERGIGGGQIWAPDRGRHRREALEGVRSGQQRGRRGSDLG